MGNNKAHLNTNFGQELDELHAGILLVSFGRRVIVVTWTEDWKILVPNMYHSSTHHIPPVPQTITERATLLTDSKQGQNHAQHFTPHTLAIGREALERHVLQLSEGALRNLGAGRLGVFFRDKLCA